MKRQNGTCTLGQFVKKLSKSSKELAKFQCRGLDFVRVDGSVGHFLVV